MSALARDWLPDTALVGPGLVDRLDSATAEWSEKWFGNRSIQRIGKADMSRPRGRNGVGENGWRGFAPGVWLDCQVQGSLAIARHALALGGTLPKASAADERLLAHYADRILQELAEQIAKALNPRGARPSDKPDGAQPEGTGIELKLQGTNGSPSLRLFIEASALVALRKRSCPPWRAAQAPASPLSLAFAASPVAFEVSLGVARMSALDLRNIAPGDVVVLERVTTDPVLLRACESGTVVAGARLLREDGEFQLKAC